MGRHAENSLSRRDAYVVVTAVWVIFSDGSIYIGSTHSNAHDVQHTYDNNFAGHSCLHFPRTQEQVEAIGPYATKHQSTIDAGWATTQRMK